MYNKIDLVVTYQYCVIKGLLFMHSPLKSLDIDSFWKDVSNNLTAFFSSITAYGVITVTLKKILL